MMPGQVVFVQRSVAARTAGGFLFRSAEPSENMNNNEKGLSHYEATQTIDKAHVLQVKTWALSIQGDRNLKQKPWPAFSYFEPRRSERGSVKFFL